MFYACVNDPKMSMDVPQTWDDRIAYNLDGDDEDPDALNDETFGGGGWDDIDPVCLNDFLNFVHV